MNNRLREFAQQSGFDIALAEQQHNGQILPNSLERFALCILKDCAGMYEAIDNGNTIEGTDNYIVALRRRYGF